MFGGKDMESIFNALESDGSEWAIKQLELLKKMVIHDNPIFLTECYLMKEKQSKPNFHNNDLLKRCDLKIMLESLTIVHVGHFTL